MPESGTPELSRSEIESRMLLHDVDLRDVEIAIRAGRHGWDALFDRLCVAAQAERSARPDRWPAFAAGLVAHPIGQLFRSDPFTARSADRPRGYAGDAVLIDQVYNRRHGLDVDEVARRLFTAVIGRPAPSAIRERRDLLTGAIDATPPGGRILSVACGHLRELNRSTRLATADIAEVVGFDQDLLSLAEVRRANPRRPVRTVAGSIRGLLARKHGEELAGTSGRGDFDFVYAATLYDDLPDASAIALMQMLFDLVAPGGRLLVANFVPDIPDVGYMESFMDWWLTYRTPEQMLALADHLPSPSVAAAHIDLGANENIVYLTITRR